MARRNAAAHRRLNFEVICVAARNGSEHIPRPYPKVEADVAFVREWLIHALVLAFIAALVAITVLH
jgi:hypothetical protein